MWKKETLNVILIEDGNNSNLTLRSILKIGQYSVSSVFGDLNIEDIAGKQPEVILLTLPLQTRNGFEILKTLKSNPQTKHIPILIVSKLNTQIYWDTAYRMGADAYLVVPNHYPYLLSKLNNLLNKSGIPHHFFIENTIAI